MASARAELEAQAGIVPSTDHPVGPSLQETQTLLHRAEQILGGPVVTYWSSLSGELTADDAQAFRALLAGQTQVDTLFLCLTSSGGSGEASLRIAGLLRQHCRRLVALIPAHAESAATMLALAAEEIHLAPLANLGPVDTALRHPLVPVNASGTKVAVGQDELARIIDLWRRENTAEGGNPYKALYPYVHPLVIGAVDRATSLSLRLCDELMAYHDQNTDHRRAVAEALVNGFPSHSYPILLSEAKRIGLPVRAMAPPVEQALAALQQAHVAMGRMVRTDVDEDHHHDQECPAILECAGRRVFFRRDMDWYWRSEGQQWCQMNDGSGWFIEDQDIDGEEPLHIQ